MAEVAITVPRASCSLPVEASRPASSPKSAKYSRSRTNRGEATGRAMPSSAGRHAHSRAHPNGVTTPVGFSVLGCGGIGRWHAKQLASLPGARLVAMADTDLDARERAAKLFGVPVFAEAEAAIRQAGVEVVSICTPPATHATLALAAASAGVHVLVEKPFALTVAEAKQVSTACMRSGVKAAVVHQQRTQPACRALKRMLDEGDLGSPVYALANLSWYRPRGGNATSGWRAQDRGGSPLLDAGVHLVDLLLWLLGPVSWVAAHSGEAESASTTTALLGFESGATAVLAISFAGNLFRDELTLELVATHGGCRLEIRDHDHAEIVRLDRAIRAGSRAGSVSPLEIEARVREESGAWRAGPRHPVGALLSRLVPGERGTLPFAAPRAYLGRRLDRLAQRERNQPQGHAAILADMARAVREGREPLVDAAHACAGLAVIEAIEASITNAGGARAGRAQIESSPPRRPPWAGWRSVRPARLSRCRGSRASTRPFSSCATVIHRASCIGSQPRELRSSGATAEQTCHWSGRDLAGRPQCGYRPYPP